MESVRALRDNSFAGLIVLGHKIYNPSIIIVISIVIFSSITILREAFIYVLAEFVR